MSTRRPAPALFNGGIESRPHVRRARHATAAMLAAALTLVLGLAGCGGGSAPGQPSPASVPLVAHTRIVADQRVCDGGSHPYCARELVLASPHRFEDSGVLMIAERTVLKAAGWHQTEGDTYDEFAADSPGNRVRVTYATAEQDLLSIDRGHLQRATPIVRELSQTLFAREPALSILIQAGSG